MRVGSLFFPSEHAMVDCLIAFGANEGEPEINFRSAVESLNATEGIEVTAVGEPMQTEPVGGPGDQSQYLNASIRLTTKLSAQLLHKRLVEIETELGRERRARWGSRTIDLDLLLYGEKTLVTETLIIPHPRMSFRRFVLEPCLKIAGDVTHPTSGKTIKQLLDCLNQRSNVCVWVNVPLEFLESLTKRGGLEGWTFMQASNVDHLTELEPIAKLMVVFDAVDSGDDLVERALKFAGPMLDLRSLDRPVEEVVAALKAAE